MAGRGAEPRINPVRAARDQMITETVNDIKFETRKVFFKGDLRAIDDLCVWHSDVAQMPRLVGLTRFFLSPKRIADDEAEVMGIFCHPLPSFG